MIQTTIQIPGMPNARMLTQIARFFGFISSSQPAARVTIHSEMMKPQIRPVIKLPT